MLVLVAVPSDVVTVMGPLVAPAGTIALIEVDELNSILAFTPFIKTMVVRVKFLPVIVNVVPGGPLVGAKFVIEGRLVATVKIRVLVPVPAPLVTLIVPVVAPVGTVALIVVAETTVKVAAVPLKLTAVAPVKLEPNIFMVEPTVAVIGLKEETTGGLINVKIPALTAVPPGVVTLILLVILAVAGTTAVICVSESTLKLAAAMVLNLTAVAPVKLAPVIMTDVPTGPEVGEKLSILGITLKMAVLVAVPPAVVTLIVPVVAPLGTVVLIEVAERTVKIAAVPLKLTAVAPVKLEPDMVMIVPTLPAVGEKVVILGAGVETTTVNTAELVAVPFGVVTLIAPVVAPAGTVAVICVSETTVKEVAAVPLKLTEVAPVKLEPVMLMLEPIAPEIGENPVMLGPAGGLTSALSLVIKALPPLIEV